MQISSLGFNAFRIQHEGVVVITNPVDSKHSFKINKQSADLVLLSEHSDDAGTTISGSPFIISEPGEYEVKSVFVYGVSQNGNTLYLIQLEEMRVAFIGTSKLSELSDVQLEVLEGADILILPVGGGIVCGPKDAAKIINQIDPRIVIPAYYRTKDAKDLETIESFYKEYSAPHEETEKLKIHKKDLPAEDTKIVVLKS